MDDATNTPVRLSKQQRSLASLRPFGRALWKARAIRCYCDGDGVGFVWRWWHPVTWTIAPVIFVLCVLMQGAPETWRDKHDVGFGMKPWFIANPDRLIWIQHNDATPPHPQKGPRDGYV